MDVVNYFVEVILVKVAMIILTVVRQRLSCRKISSCLIVGNLMVTASVFLIAHVVVISTNFIRYTPPKMSPMSYASFLRAWNLFINLDHFFHFMSNSSHVQGLHVAV